MPIVNRDLSLAEKRKVFQQEYAPAQLVTGSSAIICIAPYPCSLDVGQYAAFGLSNTPTVQIVINRFIPGTGFTAFSINSAQTVVAFGTSGVAASGISLPQIGSTLTTLLVNDVVMMQVAGTNAAMTGLAVEVALRPLQDLVTQFGFAI